MPLKVHALAIYISSVFRTIRIFILAAILALLLDVPGLVAAAPSFPVSSPNTPVPTPPEGEQGITPGQPETNFGHQFTFLTATGPDLTYNGGANDAFVARISLTTLVVNSNNDVDDGSCNVTHCSLREAIHAANMLPDSQTITFNIPGAGPHTITPASALPTISDPATIDGSTQPGASCAAWPPMLRTELNGSSAGFANGLYITAGNSTVRGLVINRFGNMGLRLSSSGNTIECNFIGTNVSGAIDLENNGGIFIDSASNIIGGTDITARNLISGNDGAGIFITGSTATENLVQGNFIGTDVSGIVALGNSAEGVLINAPGNTIGGIAAGAGNLISGNRSEANIMIIGGEAVGNQVQGNYIGTDVSGTVPLNGGTDSIEITDEASNNTIGGTVSEAGNLISGGIGISIRNADGNLIQGNFIGTDRNGASAIPSNVAVALDSAHNNIIGGILEGAGNTIAFNGLGIIIDDFSGPSTNNAILSNIIFSNDNADHWADADIQILAKNMVQPHAYVAGLMDEDTSHLIRVGRYWNGDSGNQGDWSQPEGFKTLVHEFGHYGLGLYDEYFGYDVVGGELAGRHQARCTGPENRSAATAITNASIMDFHYTTSELADAGRWTINCQGTAQHQLNGGEADWQTLLRLYSDPTGQGRWQLVRPDQRAGLGQVIPGPESIPAALPFPQMAYTNEGDNPQPFSLQVCYQGIPYREGAWVTLAGANGKAIDQGLTDADVGQLEVFGARSQDTLRVVSISEDLSALKQVEDVLALGYLELAGAAGSRAMTSGDPYLRLWPTTSNGHLDGLRLSLSRTLPQDSLRYALTGSDQIGPSAALPYDSGNGEHRAQVGFVPAGLAGYATVLGNHGGRFIELNVNYRLQQALNSTEADIFSNDGNLKLHLDSEALPLNEIYVLIASPWGLPGLPPPGLDIIGEAYEITASNSVTSLEKPGVLRLRYDEVAGLAFTNLAIYYWDFSTATWHHLGGQIQAERHEVTAPITGLGLYALMGAPASASMSSHQQVLSGGCGPLSKIYLPFITRN